MRIIGGQWRSRRLERPDTEVTRPVPDRVRQAIFDIVTGLWDAPGRLPPIDVADAFSGSGSMGLEALSRGARRCAFFETDRAALLALRSNVRALGAERLSQVVALDAWRSLVTSHEQQPFEIIFLDPPYADSDDPSEEGRVRRLLHDLAVRPGTPAPPAHATPALPVSTSPAAEPAGPLDSPILVLHHRRSVRYDLPARDVWEAFDRREIGSNAVTFFRRANPATMQRHVRSEF